MITRRPRYDIVDFNQGDTDNDSIKSYCKHCEKFGLKVALKNTIYSDGESIPVDNDQFRQCHECGNIVPIYELEKEASIKDVVEIVDNPFDIGKNEFLGIDNRTSVNANKRKRRRDRERELDSIKDDDLKRELASGQTKLISYSES
jgi:hypothetical protein